MPKEPNSLVLRSKRGREFSLEYTAMIDYNELLGIERFPLELYEKEIGK